MVSYVFVNIPGKILNNIVQKKYKIDDWIIGDIHYTKLLPYTFIQVVICLIVLFYCFHIMFKILDLRYREHIVLFLLLAIVILNMPDLKANIKILKYNAISLVFSICSIVSYLYYKKNDKNIYLLITIISYTLAYLEKDTSFSIIVIVLFIESIFISFKEKRVIYLLRNLLLFYLNSAAIFVIICYVMVPKVRYDIRSLFAIFDSIKGYIPNTRILWGGFLLIPISLLALISIRKIMAKHESFIKNYCNSKKITNTCLALCLLSIVLLIWSMVYQTNNMVLINTASDDVLKRIASDNLYVSPRMANVSFSTLDRTYVMTVIKTFLNHIRIFVYVVPECVSIMFILSFLVLYYENRKITGNIAIVLLLSFLFPFTMYISYSVILSLPESIYDTLAHVLIAIYSVLVILIYLKNHINDKGIIIPSIVLIIVLLLRPMIINNQSYFGYMSIFRSAELENTDILSTDNYPCWNWCGWGETFFYITKYLEKTREEKVKVTVCYTGALYENRDIIEEYHLPFNRNKTADPIKIRRILSKLKEKGVQYITVNKNVVFRSGFYKYILSNFRDKAIFIDKVGRMEYGYLFKVDEILESRVWPE
jgi:hypothetical protein